MLVLTRKVGERLWIGDRAVVTVLQAGRGRIRLGVEAPEAIAVWREEAFPSATGNGRSPAARSREPGQVRNARIGRANAGRDEWPSLEPCAQSSLPGENCAGTETT